jgi:hypothetical protein
MKSSLPTPQPPDLRNETATPAPPPVVVPPAVSQPPQGHRPSENPSTDKVDCPPCDGVGDDRLTSFLQQVEWVLADQRGMTAKAQIMIAAIARDRGVSQEEADEAIRSLQPRGVDFPSVERGEQVAVDIEPPPIAAAAEPPSGSPPKQITSPQLIFRAYLAEALGQSSREEISERRERRMIEEGTRKLGLAEVFARQIVQEVAAAMGKRLASSVEDAPAVAGDEAGDLPPEALGEFLEQAVAILTEQRGVNARSRVLLAAAASSCGLNETQMERALQLLQGEGYDPHAADARQAEREQAFRDAILESFQQLPHRLLHARDEQRWLNVGAVQYGLPAERVGDLIAGAAAQVGVRMISTDKASGHVYELAADLLDQGYRIERAIRSRILLEGSQWGLSEEQVDAILQDVLSDRRRVDSTRRRLTSVALCGAGVLGALLLMLVWVALSPRGERGPTAEPAAVGEAGIDVSVAGQIDGQQWWSDQEELLIAATRVRIMRPDLKDSLNRLGSLGSVERESAYRVLVPEALASTDLRVQGQQLRDFFSGCLALEPADAAADALVESLLNLVPKRGDPLPREGDATAYELPFWAVRTILDSLVYPGLSDARGDRVAASLGVTLESRVDRSGDWRDMEQHSMTALCQRLYGVIVTGAASQPQQAAPFFAAVTRRASRYLATAAIDQRTADLLTAVLPAAENDWREYEYLLQYAMNSNEPSVVLRIVDLYEQTSTAELQEFLAERLLRRVRLLARSVPHDDVARRVREALGVKQPVNDRQRWKQVVALIGDRPVPDVGQPTIERLQYIVDTVHAGTLSCALARGETGYAVFDELLAAGPPVLAAAAAQASTGPQEFSRPGVSSSMYRNVLVNIDQLSDTRNRRRESAPLYLRYLATVANQLPNLPREPAERLARYLMAGKSDGEHQAVLQYAHAVTRWPNVRLALADEVMQSSANRDRVVELMSKVLDRAVEIEEDGKWQQELRDHLLLEVIRASGAATSPTDGAERIYDDLADMLRDAYATRARLLGVPADRYSAASTTAELLRLIIENDAASATRQNQGSSGLSPALRDLPEKMVAIDYVSENDLQRTVLLQRMWLDLLVARLAQSGELPADQARRLLDELSEADRQAVDVIQQLADAERIHTRIWLSTHRAAGTLPGKTEVTPLGTK